MVDVVDGVPQGKGLDQWQSGPIEGFDTRVIGTNGYDEAAGADMFVVTAGIARKPGMSRDDLVKTNAGIVRSVSEQIARVAPKAIIMVVSNPLDVMCYVAMKASGFPRERVIGMAGVLDTARYRTFLAEALDVSVEDIQAMVLGGHGDTMVPLVSYTTRVRHPGHPADRQGEAGCDRRPHPERRSGDRGLPQDRLGVLRAERGRGADGRGDRARQEARAAVLGLAPGRVRHAGTCSAACPCKLGRNGLEQIIEVELTDAERAELHEVGARRCASDAGRSVRRVPDGERMNPAAGCLWTRRSARRSSWRSPG